MDVYNLLVNVKLLVVIDGVYDVLYRFDVVLNFGIFGVCIILIFKSMIVVYVIDFYWCINIFVNVCVYGILFCMFVL